MDPRMASKMPQDRPNTGPRRSWRAIFSISNIVLILDGFWVRFWAIWAPQMPPFGHPLGDQNPTKNRSKTGLLLMSPQDRPKIAQDPPKRAPRAPKTPPRPPQDPQKCPQQAPDTPRKVQKRSQNSAAGTWDRDRQTSFPVFHQRGVIPKAGGAAGDSAAGVLDPAAPPPRWGRV